MQDQKGSSLDTQFFRDINAVSVDDDDSNLMLIEAMASELGITVHSFTDPRAALAYMRQNPFDLVFADYQMPGMNGIELIKSIRQEHRDIPVIMITAVNSDHALKLEAIEAGATEFLNKPINMPEFRARIINLSHIRMMNLLLKDRALLLKNEVAAATEKIVSREHETIQILGRVADYKDFETGIHISRVARYAQLLTSLLGESTETQELMFTSVPLHDIGKVGIPDSIIRKKGKLTSDEYKTMQTHPAIGYNILKETESPYLKFGAIISLSHHERFDGTGYPNSLEGEEIPLAGRITAVCDVFDALVSERPYKEAWSYDNVAAYYEENRGRHFDPVLCDLFLKNFSSFIDIHKKHS